MNNIKRWALLILLMIILGIFFYFHLYRYLSFESLRTHHLNLLSFTERHFVQALLRFMVIYTIAEVCFFPGGIFLTLTAGLLFGPILGAITVIISATTSAIIVFMAVKLALREWVAKKTTKWLKSMERGFQAGAFSYLLSLRLIPIFPFWLVNIVPACLGIPLRTFVSASVAGFIPGAFVFASIGNSFGYVFDAVDEPTLSIIFNLKILLPLIALALLSLVPVGYKVLHRIKNVDVTTL